MSKKRAKPSVRPVESSVRESVVSVRAPSVSSTPTPTEASPRPSSQSLWNREAVESIVIAIVLALLFRTFEAEAFVIPTGSMAPTLQGRHKDLECSECGYRYRVGDSMDESGGRHRIQQTVCPSCGYYTRIDPKENLAHDSFTGDRILVNKFIYQMAEPRRWDVIVFKFPGNAKQNYIKRLVGLPGETIRIQYGDILTAEKEGESFAIVRKPDDKLLAMLQPVHDSEYPAPSLIKAGWPHRWQDLAVYQDPNTKGVWQSDDQGHHYTLNGSASKTDDNNNIDRDKNIAWLRYQHLIPDQEQWKNIANGGQVMAPDQHARLVTDFYEYNAAIPANMRWSNPFGQHWVGDLCLEATVQIESEQGELWLDLVEAGHHYRCRVDVATGVAALSIDFEGQPIPFAHIKDGAPVSTLSAETPIKGVGRYDVRFSNVDDQMRLWVNNRRIEFNVADDGEAGSYTRPANYRPHWSPQDPGDLMPAGIGGTNLDMQVSHLRLFRDVYYRAITSNESDELDGDYDLNVSAYDLAELIDQVIHDPTLWATTPLFQFRHADFSLEQDQFFPLGDNSPQSRDARLWPPRLGMPLQSTDSPEVSHYVEREYLIGKAFFIYWPHPWYAGTRKAPIIPTVGRMGVIR